MNKFRLNCHDPTRTLRRRIFLCFLRYSLLSTPHDALSAEWRILFIGSKICLIRKSRNDFGLGPSTAPAAQHRGATQNPQFFDYYLRILNPSRPNYMFKLQNILSREISNLSRWLKLTAQRKFRAEDICWRHTPLRVSRRWKSWFGPAAQHDGAKLFVLFVILLLILDVSLWLDPVWISDTLKNALNL